MKSSAHQKLYQSILKLYPKPFRDQYGTEMLQLFSDSLRESTSRVWNKILKELPASLAREHWRTIAPRITRNAADIFIITLAVVAFIYTPTLFSNLGELINTWLNHLLRHDLSNTIYGLGIAAGGIDWNPAGIVAYAAIGAITALCSSRHAIRNAIFVSILGFVLSFFIPVLHNTAVVEIPYTVNLQNVINYAMPKEYLASIILACVPFASAVITKSLVSAKSHISARI